MTEVLLNFLSLIAVSLPALMFRPLQWKRYGWSFAVCALAGAFLFSFSFYCVICALFLGLCLYFSVYQALEHGKVLAFCLCWGGCLAALSVASALTAIISFVPVRFLLTLATGLGFGFASRWLSRWTFEDAMTLSAEQQVSPRPLLLILLLLVLLQTLPFRSFPGIRAIAAVLFQLLSVLILALWNNMTLAVRHSLESNQHSRQAYDRANRGQEAELQRRLTESNNRLVQLRLAYRKGDAETMERLLGAVGGDGRVSYSSFLPLDAILRHRALEARNNGLLLDYQLQLDRLEGFSVSDVGVVLDLMLAVMCERHYGAVDTLRLRMQEWNDVLILTVGRHDGLRTAQEDKIAPIRQLAEEYNGRLDFSETGTGICLSAVLFRPVDLS